MLSVEDLTVDFDTGSAKVHRALDCVSLSIAEGETVGLVGESGSGKSVLASALLGLLPQNATVPSGRILWIGRELRGASRAMLRKVRGREVAMVFQDPQAALNPVYPVGEQLRWVLALHRGLHGRSATSEAKDLMAAVKLENADQVLAKFPAELSGGMCQRVMIAMALACRPKLLVADEPTSALDVTTQAEIVQLIKALQVEHHMALLFVSHDIRTVARICDRTVVLYRGQIVEEGPTASLMSNPQHDFTKRLVAAARLEFDPRL